MKRFLGLALLVMATLAGADGFSATTVVSGTYLRKYAYKVILSKPVYGVAQEVSAFNLNTDGKFAFALTNVQEGFYYLSDQQNRYMVRLYLKANDKVEVNIGEDGRIEWVSGSEECKKSVEWERMKYPFWRHCISGLRDTSSYKVFFPVFEKMLQQKEAFVRSVHTNNARFNSWMKFAAQHDMEYGACNYLLLPGPKQPSKEEMPAWYRNQFTRIRFSDTRMLGLAEGYYFLVTFPTAYYLNTLEGEAIRNKINTMKHQVAGTEFALNDTLKGLMAVSDARKFKAYDDLRDAMGPYERYFVTDTLKNRYDRVLASLSGIRRGAAAYNFSLPDTSGKLVQMSDLKGKVVLLDFWATWCGPCMQEMPYMKVLEREFHGKPVAFVGVSIDKEKDQAKWKSVVAKEQLPGYQVIAHEGNSIQRYYGFGMIPTFILIDANGKVITVDAPRPSSADLKQLIESNMPKGGE